MDYIPPLSLPPSLPHTHTLAVLEDNIPGSPLTAASWWTTPSTSPTPRWSTQRTGSSNTTTTTPATFPSGPWGQTPPYVPHPPLRTAPQSWPPRLITRNTALTCSPHPRRDHPGTSRWAAQTQPLALPVPVPSQPTS